MSNSVLHIAVENNDLTGVVAALKSTQQDVDAPGKYGRTALHMAAKSGNLEIVNILLDRGADVNKKNTHGFTSLYVASVVNNVSCMKILLSHPQALNIDINATDLGGMTALISACCNGCNGTVISCLLQHGADTGLRDSIGRTAADWAREKQFNDLVAILAN